MEAELPADIKEKGKDETVTDSQRQNDHPQTIEVELKVTFTMAGHEPWHILQSSMCPTYWVRPYALSTQGRLTNGG